MQWGVLITMSSREFFWEFFLVFLESLGWLRGSSMGICEALCDFACEKVHTNTFAFWVGCGSLHCTVSGCHCLGVFLSLSFLKMEVPREGTFNSPTNVQHLSDLDAEQREGSE